MMRLAITGVMGTVLLSACHFNSFYSQSVQSTSAITAQVEYNEFVCSSGEQISLKRNPIEYQFSLEHRLTATNAEDCMQQIAAGKTGTEHKVYLLREQQGDITTESKLVVAHEATGNWPVLTDNASKADQLNYTRWLDSLPHDFADLPQMKAFNVSQWQKTHIDSANDVRTVLTLINNIYRLDTYIGNELRVTECSNNGEVWQDCGLS